MRLLFAFLLCTLSGCRNTSEKTGLEGKEIPHFKVLLMDSSTFLNTENIPGGKPIVLCFFSPRCSHCIALTQELTSKIKDFSEVRFYMITSLPFKQLEGYYKAFHLKDYANITVGYDYGSSFLHYFHVEMVPYMAIYGKDKKLIKVMFGRINTNIIKNIAQ